jgi:predicted RNA-binding Zn-ribbon protein involved in translation (DUF1610 family)
MPAIDPATGNRRRGNAPTYACTSCGFYPKQPYIDAILSTRIVTLNRIPCPKCGEKSFVLYKEMVLGETAAAKAAASMAKAKRAREAIEGARRRALQCSETAKSAAKKTR